MAVALSVASGSFLAAMGSCTETSCRLLYESAAPLTLDVDDKAPVTLEPTSGAPRVHVITGLKRATHYKGSVGGTSLAFKTAGEILRVAFLSCNRGIEDGDFGFYEELQRTPCDLIVHLGDQVYADILARSVTGDESFESLLEKVRNVYRKSWTPIVGALLSSSNIMLPDDHEVLNNLDTHRPARFATFVRAAKQAFFEYQYALYGDCPSFDVAQCPLFRLHQLSPGLSLLLLDTRFERAFVANDESLLGPRQWDFLGVLPVTSDAVIVASSVPLMAMNQFLCWVAEVYDDEYYPLAGSRPLFGSDVIRVLDMATSRFNSSVLIGGDFHHYARSSINNGLVTQLVTSGMTSGSTTARSPAGALLFWAASLFPASLGSYRVSAPSDIFLGKNFVVLDYSSGVMKIEPHFETGLTGSAARMQWLVANVKLWHYASAIFGMVVMVLALFLSRSKRQAPVLDVTEILPGRLFLSSAGPVVQHWASVQSRFSISAVLSITERDMPVLVGLAEHLQIKVPDNRDADLYRKWRDSGFDFIARNKCVLVHCGAGRSRSAATVMAYLLHSGVVSGLKDAYLFVKRLRKEAQPNVGFMRDVARVAGDTKESRDFVARIWIERCNMVSVIDTDDEGLQLGWRCLEENGFHSAQAFLAVMREKRVLSK